MASTKRAYHHGDLRRALIDASLALIDEGGVSALTLRAAAKRVGVSHAAPGPHFGSRDGLLDAIATEGFDALGDALEKAAAIDGTPLEQLQASGVAYVRYAAREPSRFRVMFGAGGGHGDTAARERGWKVLHGRSLEVCLALGEPDRADTLTMAAWSLVHGLAMLWLDGALRGIPDEEALARVAVGINDLVGRGLRADR